MTDVPLLHKTSTLSVKDKSKTIMLYLRVSFSKTWRPGACEYIGHKTHIELSVQNSTLQYSLAQIIKLKLKLKCQVSIHFKWCLYKTMCNVTFK